MRSDDPLKKLIAEALKHDTKSKHWNVDRDRDYTDFEENDGHQREADALIKHHKYKIDSDAEEDPSWRHLNAIEHYTNDGSVFNHDLIKSKGRLNFRKMHPEDQSMYRHLDEATTSAPPLKKDMHVYSGVKGLDLAQAFKKGKGVVHMPAYTSTSINPGIAITHSSNYDDDKSKPQHIMHFQLPKGYDKGRYIEEHSNCPSEREYLMARGQKWKLTNHEVLPANEKKNIGERHIWSVVPHTS